LDTGDAVEPQASPRGNWPPPGYPIVEGLHALTKSWSITLPAPFTRRIEDGSLVLWRPGLTLWINAFHNDHHESQAERLASAKDSVSPDATDVRETAAGGVTRLTYRLREDGVRTVMATIIADSGLLHAAIYFDDEHEAPTALGLAASFAYSA
jgi:hypothetical protein